MSIRQLRARLSRLTPSSTAVIGQDRDRDRRRREELRGRKLSPTGLTELDNAEYLKLEPLFHEEDRDHDRLSELSWKEFYAKIGARACGLELGYPPDPNDPLAAACGKPDVKPGFPML